MVAPSWHGTEAVVMLAGTLCLLLVIVAYWVTLL
jgi:hypothetical protein